MTTALDALEQLARAATPGPWDVTDGDGESVSAPRIVSEDAGGSVNTVVDCPDAELEDAAFIAAANPAAVLELVERVRAAEDGMATTPLAALDEKGGGS